MTQCPHDLDDRIAAVLLGEASAPAWRALRIHLAGCAGCRDRYDRAAGAVARLEGAELAPAVVDHLRDAILEAVARQVEGLEAHEDGGDPLTADEPLTPLPSWAEGAEPLELSPPPETRGPGAERGVVRAAILGVLGTLAVVSVVALLRAPAVAPPPQAQLAPRGGAAVFREGFRLFCLEVDTATPAVRATGASPGGVATCAGTDRVQFTYTTEAESSYLSVFSVDAGGVVRWYWPREAPVALGAAQDQPLPGSVALEVNHRPGVYTVFAVFGATASTREEVESAARGGGERVYSARMEVE